MDPGAGIGSLTAALVSRVAFERPGLEIILTAVEVDSQLQPYLQETLKDCAKTARDAGSRISTRLIAEEFLPWAVSALGAFPLGPARARFDLVILNPPYRKINAQGYERQALAAIQVDVTNLYVVFLALSVALLEQDGQLAAITPRSFANGPYFRSFRRYFFESMAFDRIHVYESRAVAFSEDDVRQETLVFHAHRRRAGETAGPVVISSSRGPADPPQTRITPHSQVVRPHDPERVVHIVPDPTDAAIGQRLVGLRTRLTDLGIEVSTGRVVDFRAKEHLGFLPEPGTIPLIHPGRLRDGGVRWPGTLKRKPSWIVDCEASAPLCLPSDTYVLVKRFTAKEERRRVVAAVTDPTISRTRLAIENHLNVFHRQGRGMPGSVKGVV